MCQSFQTNNERKKRERKATRIEMEKHKEIRISKLAKMDLISLIKIITKTEQNKNGTDATEFGHEYELKKHESLGKYVDLSRRQRRIGKKSAKKKFQRTTTSV